jgi:hypothetical protein
MIATVTAGFLSRSNDATKLAPQALSYLAFATSGFFCGGATDALAWECRKLRDSGH